jgi:hypothetical protein
MVLLKENGINERELLDSLRSCGAILHPPPDVVEATDVHHVKKRGKYMLDVSTWLAVCRETHIKIHQNPAWARANGYLM